MRSAGFDVIRQTFYLAIKLSNKYKIKSTVRAIKVGMSIILNAAQKVFHFSEKVDFDLDFATLATADCLTPDISLIDEPSS